MENRDMKTAEEVLKEFHPDFNPGIDAFLDEVFIEDILEAMKAYALAAIEEQLKVTAKETVRDIEEYLHLYRGKIEEEDILGTTRIELK
jgi:hypothetical protein